MKKVIFLTILFLFDASLTVFAQALKVTKFEQTNDLSASRFEKKDINGVPCGLIKVWLPVSEAKFVGNVVESTYLNGEWWVYMTKGSKRVTIKTSKYPPLRYVFADENQEQIQIQSNVTYVMTVGLPNKGVLLLNGDSELLSSSAITIDGKEEKYDEEKRYELEIGTHKVCALLDCYKPFEQTVTIKGGEIDTLDIALIPICKEITIHTYTDSENDYAVVNIYVNGQYKGWRKWAGVFPFGSYEVVGRSKGYKSLKKSIYVNEHTEKDIYLELKRFKNYITANVAYGFAPQESFGMSYGRLQWEHTFDPKYFGWFVSIMSNFKSVSSSGDCDAEGFLADGSYPGYNGTQQKNRLSIMAGGLLPLFGDYSHIRIGVGYGTRNLYWETNDGLFYKNLGYSTKGFDGSVGLQFCFSRVVISADYVVTNFKFKQFSEIKIGAGFIF